MKYIKLLLCLCLLYTPFAFAVELPPNNSWSWKHHEKMREQARLKARLVKQINESGSSKTISAIVETKPTASKVGNAMMKRITSAKGNVYGALGSYAVIELIEAIGWVMKDGSYVKLKYESDFEIPSDLYDYEYRKLDGVTYAPLNDVLKEFEQSIAIKQGGSFYYDSIRLTKVQYTDPRTVTVYYDKHFCESNCSPSSDYVYGDPWRTGQPATFYGRYTGTPPEPTEVPLTPALLGAAMLGAGYSDPVDPSKDSIVNTDQWTGVPEAYTPDDSGIGNELAEELENKADNAPQTPDGKESSLTDSKYSNDLSSNDNANDRSWQSGDGTEGSTDSTQTTDPETGTTSNTGTFKLPAFCDWAMTMCQWYDDWTSSDKVQKDHMTKTEEHQTEEKSFWEDVKDWFDWTKEPVDEEPETEEEEPDTQGIFDRTFDTAFSLSKECPPDIPFSLETEFFSGSWNISMNWLCIIFTFLGYPLVFLSHCVGLWILYEAVVQREIKW